VRINIVIFFSRWNYFYVLFVPVGTNAMVEILFLSQSDILIWSINYSHN